VHIVQPERIQLFLSNLLHPARASGSLSSVGGTTTARSLCSGGGSGSGRGHYHQVSTAISNAIPTAAGIHLRMERCRWAG
jgi:hypothetical protein